MDVVKDGMAEVEVTEEDTGDMNNWRWKIRCGDPWWEKLKDDEVRKSQWTWFRLLLMSPWTRCDVGPIVLSAVSAIWSFIPCTTIETRNRFMRSLTRRLWWHMVAHSIYRICTNSPLLLLLMGMHETGDCRYSHSHTVYMPIIIGILSTRWESLLN